MQLFLYEEFNRAYRQNHAMKLAADGKGPVPFAVAVKDRVEELIDEKLQTLDTENGEDLTPDDIAEIHRLADMDVRAKMNLNVKTKGKRGEVEDYLEVRRPFGHQERSKI